MSDVVIRVENLSKQYRLGQREPYKTLRDTLTDAMSAPLRRFRSTFQPSSTHQANSNNTIWALKDVSFEVERGEVVGIIGRNGAGKTTLLKVLSRITEPTEGFAEIRGRVGSLLEVGTGFHPELTGRENIYLNGAILGMKKAEIDRKFDEIVAFAEIEKFLDMPVKRYSSGMSVRLAFAVAAHLEPEILLVDEVLAVGDTAFRKKCLGKIEDVAKEGRTVLFVSHNLAAIQALCSRAILIQAGKIVSNGPVSQTVNEYLTSMQQLVEEEPLHLRQDRTGGDVFRFQGVEFLDPKTMAPLNTLISGKSVLIKVKYLCYADKEVGGVDVLVAFYHMSGTFLFACRSDAVGKIFRIFPKEGALVCKIPKWPLNRGRYYYDVAALLRGTILDWVREAGFVDVEAGDYYGTGILPSPRHQGVFVDYDWEGHG